MYLAVILGNHYGTLTVFCDVLAGCRVICGVDTDWKAPGKKAAEKADDPLWRIVANNVDGTHEALEFDK